MAAFVPNGFGWQRDLPDPRDLLPRDVAGFLASLNSAGKRPQSVDWREYFPPASDQQNLPAGTAHACVGLLQYFTRRASGRLIEPSPWFVHNNALKLNCNEERCASVRDTLKALLRFGIPPARCYSYAECAAAQEPPAFTYSFVKEVETMQYVRLDGSGQSGEQTLATIRDWLAAGFASVIGMTVYTSISTEPDIPSPTRFDDPRGGQVAVMVGYDDGRRIRSDKGAFRIRNSWGESWGDQGYGWLPYAYIRKQLAADCWTLLRQNWLESDEFHRPAA